MNPTKDCSCQQEEKLKRDDGCKSDCSNAKKKKEDSKSGDKDDKGKKDEADKGPPTDSTDNKMSDDCTCAGGQGGSSEFSFEKVSNIADFIREKITTKPKILIICGSGLGPLADAVKDPIIIEYSDIPDFPVSTVPGHEGKLVFGKLSGANVVVMKGRFHYYEGYSLKKCTLPIRVLKLLGVETLIVTNAAGGINPDYKVGDIMIIKDHVNWFCFGGQNPLRGPNDDKFGPRFFPVNKLYDATFRKKAKKIACEMGLAQDLQEGVYAQVCGPNYETIAEYIALKNCGVDAVGMSTVPEALVAYHCGMKVFGFSLITDKAMYDYDDDYEPVHEEVLKIVEEKAQVLQKYVAAVVGAIKSCTCSQ